MSDNTVNIGKVAAIMYQQYSILWSYQACSFYYVSWQMNHAYLTAISRWHRWRQCVLCVHLLMDVCVLTMQVKVGDKECDYMKGFYLYITTKLPNPSYTPEVKTLLWLMLSNWVFCEVFCRLILYITAGYRLDIKSWLGLVYLAWEKVCD